MHRYISIFSADEVQLPSILTAARKEERRLQTKKEADARVNNQEDKRRVISFESLIATRIWTIRLDFH